ncbi:MAG: acetyl-CoA carboxylase, biotin carboxyl carrier protein, partial [Cyclobacteriaceae bacterium]|nr:acetyl-CoA carboxylase, biotin carboxyl carrier protein [Cyclobacteriaceae bacterium]
MKTKEIRDLIEFISQTGLNEVNIETEELKLSVKREADITKHVVESAAPMLQAPAAVAPVASPQNIPASAEAIAPAQSNNYIEVKSPMIGTFYRSSNPESPVFA